jgi:imidazolonepropionase
VFAIFAKRLVTCDPAWSSESNPLGVIERGGFVVDGERIVHVGPRDEVLALFPNIEITADLDQNNIETPSVVTPGLVDAHTHAPWVGSRDAEYALRMAGAGYEEIAAAGGGIVSSMRAIRSADVAFIEKTLLARIRRMMSLGVTTVECKSGYGLDLESERKQLDAVRSASVCPNVPRLVPTYLALHAVPPEARSDRAAYIRHVESVCVPTIAAEGLARFVDVYVDRSAFSVEEARPVLRRALDCGLGVRLHVGQFADVGGAQLAAEFGAASVDHVEHVGASGIEALARALVHVVLLPTASLTLGQTPPPVDFFRRPAYRWSWRVTRILELRPRKVCRSRWRLLYGPMVCPLPKQFWVSLRALRRVWA